MTKHAIHTALLGFLMLVMLCGSAMAGDGCTGCNAGCADCCEFWQDDDGVSNFIEIGVTSEPVPDVVGTRISGRRGPFALPTP